MKRHCVPSQNRKAPRHRSVERPAGPSRALVASAHTSLCLTTLLALAAGIPVRAEEAVPSAAQASPSDSLPAARNFYTTLEDVLSDFEFDLRNGQVAGLQDLAIRTILTSEAIPTSFKSHLELVVTEKILRHSRTQVIQCLPCRARKLQLQGADLQVLGNEANPIELNRLAKQGGIRNFMDLSFTYLPDGMSLSMAIIDPDTGSIVWSRSYHSESSRSARVRQGEMNSVLTTSTGSPLGERATPPVKTKQQWSVAVHYNYEPNYSGSTSALGPFVRWIERYDDQKKEVGLEAGFLKDFSPQSETTSDDPTTNAFKNPMIHALFVHTWNLGDEEHGLNQSRSSITAAIGGAFGTGLLGAYARGSYEWRLARHFAVAGNLGFRPPTTSAIGTPFSGGATFGASIHYLF